MFKSDIARTIATVVCTIVFSATTVIAAVGPAHTPSATVATARLSA
ncbi:hypothetical protein [Sphingomonas sp.]|jgi:hypothetical protein